MMAEVKDLTTCDFCLGTKMISYFIEAFGMAMYDTCPKCRGRGTVEQVRAPVVNPASDAENRPRRRIVMDQPED